VHNLIHIAAGDIGGLFWIVVVIIAIIAQIVKARKQFDKGAPQQDQPPAEGDPAEELRKFLEGLGQAQKAPPPHVPPPVQRASSRPAVSAREAQRSIPRPTPIVRPRAEPPPVPVHEVAVSARPPVPEAGPSDAEVLARYRAELASARAASAKPASKWQQKLAGRLARQDRQLLKEAIILREVFGAPAALRRREIAYPLL